MGCHIHIQKLWLVCRLGALMKQTLTPAAMLLAVTIYLFESTTAAMFGNGQNSLTVELIIKVESLSIGLTI